MKEESQKVFNDYEKTENKLKATNQQLTATEQQLRAMNLQLTANNQQLQATEQQLRAANQQLRASEELAQTALQYADNIIDTLREPFLILDHDLKVVSANQSFYNNFKISVKNTIGRYIYELGNNQWDIPALRKLLEDILPEKTIITDYEVEHTFDEIGRKIMLLNVKPLIRKKGKEKLILFAIEDITVIKDAEEKLKATNQQLSASEQQLRSANQQLRASNQQLTATEQQLRASNKQLTASEKGQKKEKEFSENLLMTANAFILTLELNANITLFNKFAEKLTGYKKEEVLGKNWFDIFIPKSDESLIIDVFSSVLKQMPEFSSYENIILCKSGSERMISWENTVLKDDNKKISGLLSIGIDITERKQAEELLKKRMNELEIFNEATVGRELKIIEHRKEINELLEKLGKKAKYEIPV